MPHRNRPAKRAAALLLAALLLALTGCTASGPATESGGGQLQRYQSSFIDLFDTVTLVVGYASTEAEFSAEMTGFHDLLEEYHQLYDIYNDYEGINNIKTINDNAGGDPVEVDRRIIDLLLFAKEMYERTDGQTNVMLGSVLALWHDAREYGINNPEDSYLPDADALAEANAHTSMDSLVIDDENNTVQITDPLARLDVGAVAKGYAAQLTSDTLRENGLDSFLLNAGGNVVCGGKPLDGRDFWVVGVEDLDGVSTRETLGATDLSVVTSGDYQRYYTVDGVRYHHLIDPATLWPAAYFDGVSVLAPDSGVADCLTTGLFCMPLEEGQKIVESLDGVEALWCTTDGQLVTSSGWADHEKK